MLTMAALAFASACVSLLMIPSGLPVKVDRPKI
jgi:hypothetical protein